MVKITCAFCGGMARSLENPYQPCPICKGQGVVTITGVGPFQTCSFCGGVARSMANPYAPCQICGGLGQVTGDGQAPTIVMPGKRPLAQPAIPNGFTLIAETRLADLRGCSHPQFDFKKLIRLCEELNATYSQGCYFAVIMLTRSLVDHVAPVFGKGTFSEVANSYGGSGKSFKETMLRLESAARKIADSHLHMPMRKTETLPVAQQVNFGAELDALLSEIVRVTA